MRRERVKSGRRVSRFFIYQGWFCCDFQFITYQKQQNRFTIGPMLLHTGRGVVTPTLRPRSLAMNRQTTFLAKRATRTGDRRELWGHGEDDTETEVVVPVVGRVPVAVGGAHIVLVVVPRAAAHHPPSATDYPPQNGETVRSSTSKRNLTSVVAPVLPFSTTRPADGQFH